MFGTGHKVRALELLSFCVWLLSLSGIILGSENGPGVKVVVKEGSDAVLPCLISTKESIIAKIFDWRKDFQKKVFFYDSGTHYNNGRPGQDQQFKGRVSHFQDQLMNGNASIKINNTKVADSGNYSCDFPRLQPRQTFNIELVVRRILKDQSGEISGASKPFITSLDVTKDWSLLQCEVQGAFPKPKVEWQDSAGNILPAEEPQVSVGGGRYYVTLKTTVTKTGRYRCVATQEEISHQIYSEIYVLLNEYLSREVEQWSSATLGLAVAVAVLLLVVAVMCRRYSSLMKMLLDYRNIVKGYRRGNKYPTDDSDEDSSDLLRRRRRRDDPEEDSLVSVVQMLPTVYPEEDFKGYGVCKKPPDDDLKKPRYGVCKKPPDDDLKKPLSVVQMPPTDDPEEDFKGYGVCKKPPDDDLKKPRFCLLEMLLTDDSDEDSSGYHLVQKPPRDDRRNNSSSQSPLSNVDYHLRKMPHTRWSI